MFPLAGARYRPLRADLGAADDTRGGMPMRFVTGVRALGAIACLLLPPAAMSAEMRGVSATEIKIGQTMPYSGPVSAFGALGKGAVASTAARSL